MLRRFPEGQRDFDVGLLLEALDALSLGPNYQAGHSSGHFDGYRALTSEEKITREKINENRDSTGLKQRDAAAGEVKIIAEESRDSTEGQDKRSAAIFVQPHGAQTASQLLEDQLNVRFLFSDRDESTVKMPTKSKSCLTQEDLFDSFFLPELIAAFDRDDERKLSILEILEGARISRKCEQWQKEASRKGHFCHFWETNFYLPPDQADLRDSMHQMFLKGRFAAAGTVAKASTTVNFVNSDSKNYSFDQHRVHMIRITDKEDSPRVTYGVVIIFDNEDENCIKKQIEMEEDVEEKETISRRPVVVHLVLQHSMGWVR